MIGEGKLHPLMMDLSPVSYTANNLSKGLEPTPEIRGWKRRWIARLVALALVGFGLYTSSYEPAFAVLALFILVVPFEKLFPRHKQQKVIRPKLSTDVSYALASPILNAIGLAVAIVIGIISLAWIPGLLLRPLVAMIPPILAPFVAFALFDFVVYWAHRWYHEVPFLWRFHAIHHSTEHLDWASGFRAHPFDGALIAPAVLFLLAAGFNPETTGIIAVIQILTGLFLHANVKWKLKPLHKLVITPEFHHWHHTNEADAIWSNYSVFFPLWDIVFGTYYMPKDKRPSVYGISEFIPDGMTEQLLHPLRGMGNPLWVLRHPFKAIASGYRFTKLILKDMWISTTRPRGHTPFNSPEEVLDTTPFPTQPPNIK
jgi:sterol desaturase/sphingolipid hydroxylase (fatty acid hydroxylase superfamily)